MKKLTIIFGLAMVLGLMAGPAFALVELKFDFDGDQVWDTHWTLMPPVPGPAGTVEVKVYATNIHSLPDDALTFDWRLIVDTTKAAASNLVPNPALPVHDYYDAGGGNYEIMNWYGSCPTGVPDTLLLLTFNLQATASGDHYLIAKTDISLYLYVIECVTGNHSEGVQGNATIHNAPPPCTWDIVPASATVDSYTPNNTVLFSTNAGGFCDNCTGTPVTPYYIYIDSCNKGDVDALSGLFTATQTFVPEDCVVTSVNINQAGCPGWDFFGSAVVSPVHIKGDEDGDGILDDDNCPNTPNGPDNGTCTAGANIGNNCTDNAACGAGGYCSMDQEDKDNDCIGDACDQLPNDYDPTQPDSDSDSIGNACDNCPDNFNQLQVDYDEDGVGNACDNCPNDPGKIIPGICGCGVADTDNDSDGTPDCNDNCKTVSNPGQEDTDNDTFGNDCDNCPNDPNPAQTDCDGDGPGDACDEHTVDLDGDGVDDGSGPGHGCDNCPPCVESPRCDYNPDQLNSDDNQTDGGDICDPCPASAINNCNPEGSGAAVVGEDGGTVETGDSSTTIIVPPGAVDNGTTFSITAESGTGFVIETDHGEAQALMIVQLESGGGSFNEDVTLRFAWADADNNSVVDGTDINEKTLVVTKDGIDIASACNNNNKTCTCLDPACSACTCDLNLNFIEVDVSGFSTDALTSPVDEDIDNETSYPDWPFFDNCPVTPNGSIKGTCAKKITTELITAATMPAVTCTDNSTCQTGEYCQMEQGDINTNGVGDVCDCYADFNDNGRIDGMDMFIMVTEANASLRNCDPNASHRILSQPGSPGCCYADSNGNGKIEGMDMFRMVTVANLSLRNCTVIPHCPNID